MRISEFRTSTGRVREIVQPRSCRLDRATSHGAATNDMEKNVTEKNVKAILVDQKRDYELVTHEEYE